VYTLMRYEGIWRFCDYYSQNVVPEPFGRHFWKALVITKTGFHRIMICKGYISWIPTTDFVSKNFLLSFCVLRPYFYSCWVRAPSHLGMRFSVVTSCLAGNPAWLKIWPLVDNLLQELPLLRSWTEQSRFFPTYLLFKNKLLFSRKSTFPILQKMFSYDWWYIINNDIIQLLPITIENQFNKITKLPIYEGKLIKI